MESLSIVEFLQTYWRDFLIGCWLTLKMSSLGIFLGSLFALVVAYMRGSNFRVLRGIARAFVEIVRNTPLIVQIFFIYFSLPVLGFRLTAIEAAVLSLAVNCSAYLAEIIRGGINSISKGQAEAGYALGLKGWQVFFLIILLPALRGVYPSITSQYILLLLSSSVVSTISARELTSIGNYIEALTFLSFEVYFTITLLYFAMALLFTFLFRYLETVLFPYAAKERS